MILDDLLVEFQIGGLTEEEKEHWNHVWHRLKPWPDAVRGLERMKKSYVLAPLSNGNVSLLVEMAKNAGLPWDAVTFTSSATAASKPAPLNPKGAAPGTSKARPRFITQRSTANLGLPGSEQAKTNAQLRTWGTRRDRWSMERGKSRRSGSNYEF